MALTSIATLGADSTPSPDDPRGTWRWIESRNGFSGWQEDPDHCRCERWLVLRADSSYEYYEQDSAGGYVRRVGSLAIHSMPSAAWSLDGNARHWIELGSWPFSVERAMLVTFLAPDSIRLYPGGPGRFVADASEYFYGRSTEAARRAAMARRSSQGTADSLHSPAPLLPKEGEYVPYEDAPVPIEQRRPTAPRSASGAEIRGTVILHVLVGKDGRVKNVKLVRSVAGLDEAAITAVKTWVFKPALSRNRPVAVWVELPIQFPPHD